MMFENLNYYLGKLNKKGIRDTVGHVVVDSSLYAISGLVGLLERALGSESDEKKEPADCVEENWDAYTPSQLGHEDRRADAKRVKDILDPNYDAFNSLRGKFEL